MEEEYSVSSSSDSKSGDCDGVRVDCHITPRGSIIRCHVLSNIGLYDDQDDDGGRYNSDVVEHPFSGIIWSRAVRKLVNQSHGFFMKLQNVCSVNKGVEPKMILEYSKRFRSAMKECVLDLKKEQDNLDVGDINEEDYRMKNEQTELFSMLEVIWHLCEILFLETLPLGCLVQQLLEWVRWHNQSIDDRYHQLLDDPPHDNDNQEYWSVLYCLTLHGRSDEVIELLKTLPDCQKYPEMYASMRELLKKIPMVQSVVGKSKTELRSQYYDWKLECKRRWQRGDFTINNNLQILCGLLCGDEQSYNEDIVLTSCEYWYEMMVGRLLYSSPLIISTDYDLHMTAEACIKQYIKADEIHAFDKILLTALHNNVINVIRISSSILSDWWFVAHLSSILYLKGSLISHNVEYGSQLTEFVLVEYAQSLYNHPSLWQIAIDYLSHCPTQGRGYIELLIERVPLDSENRALKVLSVCEQYGLKYQSQTVCRVMARKAYSRGQLGNALTWSVKGRDTSFAAFTAERYFEDYELTGNFKDLSLLDNLGDAMLLSKKLMFLGKYREIQVHYSMGEFSRSGELLTNLLECGTIPNKYLITVLSDTIPLLELQDELVFNTTQTYALMRWLLTAEGYLNKDASVESSDENPQFDLNHEKIAVLRLSLVRNLQRALFH